MLVVTRRTGQAICIGDNIEITVLDIGGDRVKIGINAPKAINVARKELLELTEINHEATQTAEGIENILEIIKSNKK
ncbi:MAG TPA: carbon storage regulator [Ruminococcaceae bacterium]|nr:carbon storage regulator [Oscillospiraceae bacterium]